MWLKCHFVLKLSRNTIFFSNIFGCLSHSHKALLCILMLENLIRELCWVDLSHHIEVWHWFNTTTNSDIDFTRVDLVSYWNYSLKTWRAHSVDGNKRGGIWDTSDHLTHSCSGISTTWLENITNVDLLYQFWVKIVSLSQYILENWDKHLFNSCVLLRTLLWSSHCSSGIRYNNYIIVTLGSNRSSVEIWWGTSEMWV